MLKFLILLAVALVISAIGFYKYVYFISLGYGFSIAGMGVAMLFVFKDILCADTIVMCLLFLVYGCRLGGYLLVREMKSAAYRTTMKTEIKDGSDMKLMVKFSIWFTCVALYILQISPVFFRLLNKSSMDVAAWVGVAIMFLGIVMESVADYQKSRAKAKNPKSFVSSGLFSFVRCPNYLGELIFWTGVFVCGITVYSGALQWTGAILGYAGIIYVMFSGARRLEIRQNRNYGEDPEYQEYVKKTPILIPFIPLYSVEKYKFLVA